MSANVLITGTSSGIGHALAHEYLRKGARVCGISRRSPADLQTNANYHHANADLSDFDTSRTVLRMLIKDTPTFNVVILNAATLGRIADLGETTVPELKQTLELNVWSNKVLLDELFATGTTIEQVVAISSGAASSAQRGWNGYSISKAALNMLISLYAAERRDTHFSSIAPGIVDTRMQEEISSMPSDPRFTSVDMLRQARGTPMMPSPEQAAPLLMAAFERALKEPSGVFTDLSSLLRKR